MGVITPGLMKPANEMCGPFLMCATWSSKLPKLGRGSEVEAGLFLLQADHSTTFRSKSDL